MKTLLLKNSYLLIIGCFVVVICYPALHELGHFLAAVSLGVNVIKVSVYPVPAVLCEVKGLNDSGVVVIAVAGTAFPFLLSLMISKKSFFGWYVSFLLRGICVLSLIISGISVSFDVNLQDDIYRILAVWKFGKAGLLIIVYSCVLVLLLIISMDKPFQRFLEYIEIKV